ncbi:cysteine dioxygenase [Flexibacter flexilis]|nr:cysteine dioxygenase family protein [Flexibacter flexilis]
MSYANKTNNKPKELVFPHPQVSANQREGIKTKEITLIVQGQGVFLFADGKASEPAELIFNSPEKAKSGLRLLLTPSGTQLYDLETEKLLAETASVLTIQEGAYYWASLDSHNFNFRVGLGEARKETMAFEYEFLTKEEQKDETLKKKTRDFLQEIKQIQYPSFLYPLRLLRDPVISTLPLKVKAMDQLTMRDIAANQYLPVANLNPVSQKLYGNIAGSNFILNDSDFPDFSDAIEYSIATPGCWAHEKLKEKATEFDKDHPNPHQVYLRITLGENGGESPGVPYVLEIWPPDCYSPIHNHANANAVIRVLYGQINVTLYPFLGAEKPMGNKTFEKDDILWISPTQNQTHKLHNTNASGPTCITIQCYMYDAEDTQHYNYFDYLESGDNVGHFDPDSDMEFLEFKAKMKEEWANR